MLEQASDGILTKIADARGRNADTYVIQLPLHFEQLARDLSWRSGKIHGIRPVFAALGDVAALVYESIERGRLSPTTEQISTHRKQRAAWHAWLDRNLAPELAEHEVDEPDSDLYGIPPSETEVDLIGTLLRAA